MASEFRIDLDARSPLIRGDISAADGELGYFVAFTKAVQTWCDENLEGPVEGQLSMHTGSDFTLFFHSEADATAFTLKWT